MSDPENVLDLALKKRQALAEELRRLDNFIATYKALKAEAPSRDVASTAALRLSDHDVVYSTSAQQLHLEMKPLTQEGAMISLLEKLGPLNVKELLTHLRAMGIPVGGKEPLNNLSSILSRSKRTAYDKDAGTWKLLAIPLRSKPKLRLPSESKEGD